ncbi:hypothetical protein CCACVL1_11893 [Corchorus capsularis]|uniref:Uncharacterized protein n=1 Tax=Corchorus capsularis TaxID=210143 RepID=A0A1R3IJ35_COCAP|nr:hypothetical protein CCACVL1_11893 [Corchorus capsularis]
MATCIEFQVVNNSKFQTSEK